jgi:predicted alpha/beta superfamily hydrolase
MERKASIVRAPSSLMSDGSFSTPGSAYFTQAMSAVAHKHRASSPLNQQYIHSEPRNSYGRLEAKARKGRIAWEGQFYSEKMKMDRTVRVYVPPSYYDLNSIPTALQRYPVIYFHDGQNAFSYMGADINWGWGNWAMDSTIEDLAARNRAQECIVVAVDCSSDRYLDYRGPAYPYTDQEKSGLRGPPHVLQAPGNSERYEAYKHFLIDELKPRIDLMYRTLSNVENTCVMGASMGGICALALCWDRPDIFGLCASLSGAFMVEHQHFLRGIVRKANQFPTPQVLQRLEDAHIRVDLPLPPFKVYLDSGISDYQGGDDGLKETTKIKQELIRLGWLEGRDLMHIVENEPLSEQEMEHHGLNRGKWNEAKANMHNEFYWKLRVWKPLEFLFPPLAHPNKEVLGLHEDSNGHLPHPGPIHEYSHDE